jgi:single-strand DNA-binding protein
MQKVLVIGNLGTDPEMRYMPDGTAVTNFSVAANHTWTDRASGEKAQETTWFRVSVWGNQAESTNEYLQKGSQVYVEGKLQPDRETGGPRLWTAQDGSVRASFEVRAFNVRFLSGQAEMAEYGAGGSSFEPDSTPREEDEIPF